MYQNVRKSETGVEDRWNEWRSSRDSLFATHPQSPLTKEQRSRFQGLNYFPYDSSLRFEVPVQPLNDSSIIEVDLIDDGPMRLRRVGRIEFSVGAGKCLLTLFMLLAYGGGLFLPFRDATNGTATSAPDANSLPDTPRARSYSYGGGRYLLDTIKHADLGGVENRLIIDFNFAYNPSCAYNPRWHCPLAPPENWLEIAIEAGEAGFPDVPVI